MPAYVRTSAAILLYNDVIAHSEGVSLRYFQLLFDFLKLRHGGAGDASAAAPDGGSQHSTHATRSSLVRSSAAPLPPRYPVFEFGFELKRLSLSLLPSKAPVRVASAASSAQTRPRLSRRQSLAGGGGGGGVDAASVLESPLQAPRGRRDSNASVFSPIHPSGRSRGSSSSGGVITFDAKASAAVGAFGTSRTSGAPSTSAAAAAAAERPLTLCLFDEIEAVAALAAPLLTLTLERLTVTAAQLSAAEGSNAAGLLHACVQLPVIALQTPCVSAAAVDSWDALADCAPPPLAPAVPLLQCGLATEKNANVVTVNVRATPLRLANGADVSVTRVHVGVASLSIDLAGALVRRLIRFGAATYWAHACVPDAGSLLPPPADPVVLCLKRLDAYRPDHLRAAVANRAFTDLLVDWDGLRVTVRPDYVAARPMLELVTGHVLVTHRLMPAPASVEHERAGAAGASGAHGRARPQTQDGADDDEFEPVGGAAASSAQSRHRSVSRLPPVVQTASSSSSSSSPDPTSAVSLASVLRAAHIGSSGDDAASSSSSSSASLATAAADAVPHQPLLDADAELQLPEGTSRSDLFANTTVRVGGLRLSVISDADRAQLQGVDGADGGNYDNNGSGMDDDDDAVDAFGLPRAAITPKRADCTVFYVLDETLLELRLRGALLSNCPLLTPMLLHVAARQPLRVRVAVDVVRTVALIVQSMLPDSAPASSSGADSATSADPSLASAATDPAPVRTVQRFARAPPLTAPRRRWLKSWCALSLSVHVPLVQLIVARHADLALPNATVLSVSIHSLRLQLHQYATAMWLAVNLSCLEVVNYLRPPASEHESAGVDISAAASAAAPSAPILSSGASSLPRADAAAFAFYEDYDQFASHFYSDESLYSMPMSNSHAARQQRAPAASASPPAPALSRTSPPPLLRLGHTQVALGVSARHEPYVTRAHTAIHVRTNQVCQQIRRRKEQI